MDELVAGPGGLLSRGLIEDDVTRYGALPRTKQERAALAGILNDFACVQYPEYAKSHSGAEVLGVPGFWQELSGVVHIWKRRNYLMPLLVIPYKDANGLIQACQIELHANDISSDDKRYCGFITTRTIWHQSWNTTTYHFVKEKLPPDETCTELQVGHGSCD